MDTMLRSIRALTDVSRLFSHLGYQPVAEPGPFGTTVAAWRGFSVIGVCDPDPTAAARRTAGRLGAMTGRGIAVALNPSRELAIAAPRLGRSGVTRAFRINLANPEPGTADHLARFRPARSMTGLALAVRLDGLLNTEIAGERFYQAFRLQHHRMTDHLGRSVPPDDRHLLALLPLIRILFLYFVQAKGWLAGQRDFLRDRLDHAIGRDRDFQRAVLDPLIFETLNQAPAARSPRNSHAGIPYLNGGLFDKHPLERRQEVHFPNPVWRDAFDLVFERFRFCVREGEEVDAIAPDMLGRVFERLMVPESRVATGTFYTPEPIVNQLVDISVRITLGRMAHIDADRLREPGTLNSRDRRALRTALRDIRVLDPAAGTGAFLLGALDTLTTIHIATADASHPSEALQFRRYALRQCLFGVDVNPVATRLAELRLWLAFIADDPTTRIDQIEPLPNLDGIVLQGDSLLDPIGAARGLGVHPGRIPGSLPERMSALRRSLFGLRGSEHHAALADMQRVERELAEELLDRAETRVTAEIRNLDTAADDPDLFGHRTGLTPTQRDRKRRLVQQREAICRWRAPDRVGVPFFSFEVRLPDVMEHGGFDLVIGNPPWVRAERLAPALRSALQNRFGWWTTSRDGQRRFRHLPDLAVAFLERAVELVRTNGTVGFLVPAKLASAEYAATARHNLVRETTLRYVHRVAPEESDLFGATTYPLALVIENKPPEPHHPVRLDLLHERSTSQHTLGQSGPWILVPDRERDALEEFRTSGRPLRALAPPALGLKTGAHRVFVGTAAAEPGTGRQFVTVAETPLAVEPRWIKPILRGRDIRPFAASPRKVMVWPCDESGAALPRLPADVAAYFRRHEDALRNRTDYRGGPYWKVFRTRAATRPHRVVWSDIARFPRAVSLGDTPWSTCIPLNTCYVCNPTTHHTALLVAAILNTSWSAVFARVYGDEARGGYRRYNARVVGELPVPLVGTTATESLIALSRQAHHGDIPDQATLDAVAADALDLTPLIRERLRALAAHYGGTTPDR